MFFQLSSNKTSRTGTYGFTLIEMLVVMLLMGLVTAMVLPSISSIYDSYARQSERKQLFWLIKKLSMESFKNASTVKVKLHNNQVYMLAGAQNIVIKSFDHLQLKEIILVAYPSGVISLDTITELVPGGEREIAISGFTEID